MSATNLRFCRFVTAVVLEIAYGRKVVADDDQFLVNAEVLDKLIAETGTAGLVVLDFLPFREILCCPDVGLLTVVSSEIFAAMGPRCMVL